MIRASSACTHDVIGGPDRCRKTEFLKEKDMSYVTRQSSNNASPPTTTATYMLPVASLPPRFFFPTALPRKGLCCVTYQILSYPEQQIDQFYPAAQRRSVRPYNTTTREYYHAPGTNNRPLLLCIVVPPSPPSNKASRLYKSLPRATTKKILKKSFQ